MPSPDRVVTVIDSHTEGEPTRVVVSGGPDLGGGDLRTRARLFEREFDQFRSGVACEPRGSEVVVGALLLEPVDPTATAAVIFFNDVGYLGMCGHGTIGLITTLAHMGRIGPGNHRIETPVGTVSAHLHSDGRVSVANVPSYRYRAAVAIDVPGFGRFTGDIAWAGNWFFLIGEHPYQIVLENRRELVIASTAIRGSVTLPLYACDLPAVPPREYWVLPDPGTLSPLAAEQEHLGHQGRARISRIADGSRSP